MAKVQRLLQKSQRLASVTLGGADVATVLGENPYCSRESFIAKKSGLWKVGISRTAARQHGMKYEAEAIERYAEAFKKVVLRPPHRYHPEYPFLGCSPDGVTTEAELVEVKCPTSRPIGPSVPRLYMPQLLVSLEILDLDVAHYVEYLPNYQGKFLLQVFQVERDPRWFRANLDALHSAVNEIELWKGKTSPGAKKGRVKVQGES
jgi:putative phage-type endonuclease